ncbi:MAG: choice-of-anchor Q domain-containing protein [Actinomycetota bacterium]
MKTRSLPGRMVAHLTVLFLITSVLVLVASPPAHAATIEVETTEDEIDDDGDCSLREAVENANDDASTHDDCDAGTGADTIELDGDETYELDDGELVLTDSEETTIDGGSTRNDPDDEVAVIDGDGNPGAHDCDGDTADATDRVIHVTAGAAVELVDVDIRSGVLEATGSAFGGGIFNEGDLTLTRAAVLDNLVCAAGSAARTAGGGGVASDGTGTLTIFESTLDGNRAVTEDDDSGFARGGGLYYSSSGGVTDIEASTFSNNVAEAGAGLGGGPATVMLGGGIWANEAVTMLNSTISGNSATENVAGSTEDGGGVYFDGSGGDTFEADYVTVTDNAAEAGGGITVAGDSGNLDIARSIVADQDEGDDCDDTGATDDIVSGGFNLDSDDTCDFDDTDDISGDDADLDSLDDNGGATETHLPDDNSDAVNVMDDSECGGVDEDQRGEERPDDDDDECDAGAVEHQQGEEGDGDGDGAAGDELDATPETATNVLPGDTTHTLTARFDESELAADEDDEIDAKIISGPNEDLTNDEDEADLSCTLGNDTCSVTYTGNGVAGTDVICVWLDTDDDDEFDLGDSEDGGNCDVEPLTPTGATDRDDTDVVEKRWIVPTPTPSPSPVACNDDVDNDGDGDIDFPADPGCSSISDTTETGTFRVASSVSIRHQASPHRFKGRVRSARARCRRERRVVVKKVRRGPDRTVARDLTNNRGRWSEPHLTGGEGRYYARARRKVFTNAFGDTIVCRRARSRTIEALF